MALNCLSQADFITKSYLHLIDLHLRFPKLVYNNSMNSRLLEPIRVGKRNDPHGIIPDSSFPVFSIPNPPFLPTKVNPQSLFELSDNTIKL